MTYASGGPGGTMSRLEQVQQAVEPLAGLIDDWDYANPYGTRLNITISPELFGFGILPQVATAGAGAAGIVILIGGAPVTITITVTGAVVLSGVALWRVDSYRSCYERQPIG
jgi:hypothetical protein